MPAGMHGRVDRCSFRISPGTSLKVMNESESEV